MHKLSFCGGGGHFGNIAGALFSALLCAASASAEVLVCDGFPIGEGAYNSVLKALNGQTITHTDVKGFSWSKWNDGGGSGAVYSLGDGEGLQFPEVFAAHGFAATGTSVGFHAPNTGNPRVGERKLAGESLPSEGTVYVRFLLNIDSTCASIISAPSKDTERFMATTCYAAGLCGGWNSSSSQYSYFFSNSRSLLLGVARNQEGGNELDLCVIDAENSKNIYTVVDADTFLADTTYLCVLKIEIGAGADGKERISAYVIPVDSYVPAFSWMNLGSEGFVEAEVWSESGKPEYFGLCGRYQTNGGYFKVDEFALATELSDVVYFNPGMPVIDTCGVSSDGVAFTVSALMEKNTATIKALAYDGVSLPPIECVVSEAAAPGNPVSGELSGLAANTTYEVYVAAENEYGAMTNKAGVVYNGTLQFLSVADAGEQGFVPGEVRISRADAAHDLRVNLAFGGTAVNGVNCEEIPSCVTIPAGETSVSVPVKPYLARPHDAATTIVLSLAAGDYIMTDPSPSASVAIENLPAPTDKNTWVAAADGLASVAANWSLGRVPAATDDILLDGDFSNAQLTWDGATEGVPSTVASWTQFASYTGRVVMATTRTGDFTCFTITGDAELNGGEWWRAGNTKDDGNTAKVWLNIAVGGDLNVGSGFKFNGYAAGFPKQKGPSPGGENGSTGGAHGGLGGGATYGYGTAYGDYREPTSLGSGQYGGDNGGGGAVCLNVTGDFLLDGTVTADGGDTGTGSGQSGGSVWIRARTMSGSGTITAEGGSPSNKRAGGGGGRISIQLSAASFGQADFLREFTGTITAAGGLDSKSGTYARVPGAAGTVYVETALDNSRGAMSLVNKNWGAANPHVAVAPVREGETWKISSLALKTNGRVGVYSGGTLRVPSFSAITGDKSTYAMFLFNGGSVTSDIRHDKLVADGFAVESAGTSSFADHTLVIPDDSSLKVSGDFTVGALIMGHTRLAKGDYSATTLAETYSTVSGDGTIHVLGLADALKIIVR